MGIVNLGSIASLHIAGTLTEMFLHILIYTLKIALKKHINFCVKFPRTIEYFLLHPCKISENITKIMY